MEVSILCGPAVARSDMGTGTLSFGWPLTEISRKRLRKPLVESAVAVSGTSSMGAALLSAFGVIQRMEACGSGAGVGDAAAGFGAAAARAGCAHGRTHTSQVI